MIIRIRMYYEGATVEAIMENRRKIEEDLTMFSGFLGQNKYWGISEGNDENYLSVYFKNANIDDYLFLRHEFYYGIFANWDEIEVIEDK